MSRGNAVTGGQADNRDVHEDFEDTRPVPSPPAAPARSYFRFRIGNITVWLDKVSYIGRRPSSPRIQHGLLPRLVRVPSPEQEVSSTHIELRQLGSFVVVTDMRSTNGSVVFAPSAEPRRLRQGKSIVVSPGTLIDIGDGNVVEVLPLEYRTDDAPSFERSGSRSTKEGLQ